MSERERTEEEESAMARFPEAAETNERRWILSKIDKYRYYIVVYQVVVVSYPLRATERATRRIFFSSFSLVVNS